ncbi:MAG: hypothetical protein Q9186_001546 [Xanthomendoza sp. 1 TL-2023]
MANITEGRGSCVAPFLELSRFPSKEGYQPGRFCAPVPSRGGSIECCLPCPVTSWIYSDNFETLPKVSNWLNVTGMVCTASLLVSFFVLPIERTSRHYLNVCFIVAVCILQLGFIIPLGAQPEQCHDAITPNDMISDLTCAFSGACLLAGGFAAISWGFLRSLSIHLQICWQVVPGRKFFWSSLLAGWGLPILFGSVALARTGVSYRFGDTCHINHDKALQDYWGPLLAFATVSTILQFATLGYCIRVYIRALFKDDGRSQSSSGLPSHNGSVKTVTAKQAYRRVQKAIAVQWRGIVVVVIIIVNVIFLAVVFVSMDNTEQAVMQNFGRAEPWLSCLVLNKGDKNMCLDKVKGLTTSESTVMAVLILMSLNGIWTLLFLGRASMIPGWIDLIRTRFARKHDFVSVDARRLSTNARPYEMMTSPPHSEYAPKTPEAVVTSPSIDGDTLAVLSSQTPKEYSFTRDAKYVSPTMSFSTPRPPSSGRYHGREWDPINTYARPWSPNTGKGGMI